MGIIIGGVNAAGKIYVDTEEGATLSSAIDYYVYGIIRTDTLSRPRRCHKKDAVSIVASLATVPSPLVCNVSALGTVSCGSGWLFRGAPGSSFSPTLQQLNATYERIVPGLFDWELPADVSLSCSIAGSETTTNLTFATVKFHSWRLSDTTCEGYPIQFNGAPIDSDNYRLHMYVNGKRVQSWDINHGGQALDPEHNTDHRLHWVHTTGVSAKLIVLDTTILDMEIH